MRYQIDPTKVDLKERKRMVFKDFMGVDALSPVFSISNKRASKMCNLISRDGSNHKRYGWEQYLQFDGAINGVFRFIINNTKFHVVYAGTTFWIKRVNIDAEYSRMQDCTDWITFGNIGTLLSRECKCFVQNDRAYFIGMGDFLVFAWDNSFSKYRLASVVNDKDTYIPTTTTNISCRETDLDENNNRIEYGQRQSYEDVNILHAYRKNKIIGSQVGGALDNARTYQLDAETISSSDIYIEGYDFNSSTSEKTDIALHSGSTSQTMYGLMSQDKLSLRDIREGNYYSSSHNLYIPMEIPLPLPSGWDEGNAITLFKCEYKENGSLRYGIRVLYYMRRTDTGLASWRKEGMIKIYYYTPTLSHGYSPQVIASKSSNTSGVERLTQGYTQTSGGSTIPSHYKIAIDNIYKENNRGRDIPYNEEDKILISDIYNESGSTFVSYYTDAIELNSSRDPLDTTIYGYVYANKGIIQLGTHTQALYARSISGEPNLIVTFVVVTGDFWQEANKISNSSLAISFGIGGNAQALFVSGYEPKPHMDWWSKELDYTYFPSGNECAMGTPNTKVKGYQVLGDSSLAIFKEYSVQEPSVYIRSGTDTNLIQGDDGTLSIQTGGYFTSGKYMSKGVIASKSIAVLQSDPMVLTQDGVCALTIDANTSSISNRVFRERSRLIDNIINNHTGREDAVAYVHNGKYYLCIGSDVYIADSRYTFSIKGDMTDTYNYEWWIWDNCPMSYIFENEDGELCFGTTDGRICKFYKGFEDIKKETYDVLTFSSVGSSISIYVDEDSQNFLEDGEEYYFKTNTPLYAKIDFGYVKEAFASYYNGKIVRKVVNGEVDETNEYKLSIEKDEETQVWNSKIINTDTLEESNVSLQDTIVLDIRNTRFKVYQPNTSTYLVASELYDAVDGSSSYLNIYKWRGCYNYSISVDRPIDLVHVQAQNVAAYWYSPALDFGTNDYEKVMLYVTIATERHTNGQVIFGWETREIEAEITSKGMDTFDFEEVNFNRIALDTTWNTSYTRNLKCNFNFIMFRFESDNDVDCCVHQFTIGYKINHKNRGVR